MASMTISLLVFITLQLRTLQSFNDEKIKKQKKITAYCFLILVHVGMNESWERTCWTFTMKTKDETITTKKKLKTHIMIPVDLIIQLLCLGAGSWPVGRLLLVSRLTDGQDLLICLTTTPSLLLPLYSSLYHNMQAY